MLVNFVFFFLSPGAVALIFCRGWSKLRKKAGNGNGGGKAKLVDLTQVRNRFVGKMANQLTFTRAALSEAVTQHYGNWRAEEEDLVGRFESSPSAICDGLHFCTSCLLA